VARQLGKFGDLSGALIRACAASNLQRDEIAKRAGLHPVTVSRIIRGHRIPDPPTWMKLRAALVEAGVDVTPASDALLDAIAAEYGLQV